YGYTAQAADPVTLPGPTLIVNQGEAVNIVLHNVNIPGNTSLQIAGQPGTADTAGISSSDPPKTYSFPAAGAGALQPGTYLYEAGLTADGPRQVAMGLYGALIVRPVVVPPIGMTGQAYADASTAFNDEAVLV